MDRLTDEKVNEAIKQMKIHCEIQVDKNKMGLAEYQFLSACEALRALGYPEDHQQQVLQAIADRGFDYCLDHNISHRDRDTGEVSFPSGRACQWGADQLLSRLRFIS